MRRKGQAAMEFLMTYGWAILAAIIAIGVLAYFGVFSPGKFVPSATVVNQPFYANAWNVQSDGTVQIELRNNGGEVYTLTGAQITWSDGATGSCTNSTALSTVNASNLATITFDCGSNNLIGGDTAKGDIVITYTKSGSNIELRSTGTIADTVAA